MKGWSSTDVGSLTVFFHRMKIAFIYFFFYRNTR